MRIVYFTHALSSCWNHGNAHFLRGVLRELKRAGHSVAAYEPRDAWSRQNLVAEHGEEAAQDWRYHYPELSSQRYGDDLDLERALDGADLVIVHEWNEPDLIRRIGNIRKRGASFRLLFHDTHHRAVSEPESMARYALDPFDGVLAFGEALAAVYRKRGWGNRVFVWHEAADTALFKPPEEETARTGLVWVGNWGDGERTAELEHFLFRPALEAGLPLDIHGVRYPASALALLKRYGIRYKGWLPNAEAPRVFAAHLATVHVPRRFYTEQLPGIPTIRVFEALACGIPLVSAPWQDTENLFTPGVDYLVAGDGAQMTAHLRTIANDPAMRQSLVLNGLAAIRSRHSCEHRMHELIAIAAKLGVTVLETT